ncbi:MAG: hypothetical protein ACYSP9_07475 [Planctomycetota bacterium]|jgi:hypothetical protein
MTKRIRLFVIIALLLVSCGGGSISGKVVRKEVAGLRNYIYLDSGAKIVVDESAFGAASIGAHCTFSKKLLNSYQRADCSFE